LKSASTNSVLQYPNKYHVRIDKLLILQTISNVLALEKCDGIINLLNEKKEQKKKTWQYELIDSGYIGSYTFCY